MRPTPWSRLAYAIFPARRRKLLRRLEIALEEGVIELDVAYASFRREVMLWCFMDERGLFAAAWRGVPARVQYLIRQAERDARHS